MFTLILVLTSVITHVLSLPADHGHDHTHSLQTRLPETWYHHSAHPAHALFVRQQTDATPAVGSRAWAATFPTSPAEVADIPQEWADALAIALADGSIPDIPPSTPTGGSPVYPADFDPKGDEVCSATYKCRNPADMWDAPDGVFGVSFDDGPLPASGKLYDYLESQDVHATHFMIGVNILYNQPLFDRAFRVLDDDIAVHTWTHPHMTTLSNEQVVGELGYTIQIIRDLTGGRLPRYWRPPYGDSDNRVRAIAEAVFGLETVIWNHDTEDWTLTANVTANGTTNGTTPETVHSQLEEWFLGPQSPGLMILEHELSDLSVQAFIDAFPIAQGAGWTILPLSQFDSDASAYRNADDNNGTVSSTAFLVPTGTPPPSSASSSKTRSGAASTSGAAAGKSAGTAMIAASASASVSSTSTGAAAGKSTGSAGVAQSNSNGARSSMPIPALVAGLVGGLAVLISILG